MKARQPHEVPLSTAAVDCSRACRARAARTASSSSARARARRWLRPRWGGCFKQLGYGAVCTPHGLRSSFRDWAAERTNFPREVLEHALAHTVGSETERAYARLEAVRQASRADAGMGQVLHVAAGAGGRRGCADAKRGEADMTEQMRIAAARADMRAQPEADADLLRAVHLYNIATMLITGRGPAAVDTQQLPATMAAAVDIYHDLLRAPAGAGW